MGRKSHCGKLSKILKWTSFYLSILSEIHNIWGIQMENYLEN